MANILDKLLGDFHRDLAECGLGLDERHNIVKRKNTKRNVGLSPAFALYVHVRLKETDERK